MKLFIIITALFTIPLFTYAIEVIPPPQICYTNCSEPMLNIYKEFLSAKTLDATNFPVVSSGECYHHGFNYDSKIRQWGVILFDKYNGELFTGGSFGFFYKENPYANWTINVVREKTPELYSESHKVYLTDSYGFADMNKGQTGQKTWKYWYKQIDNNFYVLGIWGNAHEFVCKMVKNAQQ